MLSKIKEILFTFTIVTTMMVLATAIFISIFWGDPELSVKILWEILGVSALCSLGNLMYIAKELSKVLFIVRIIVHYIYINVVVLAYGLQFKWFYLNQLPMIAGMLVLIAVVFSIVWVLIRCRDGQLANKFNERLEEYYKIK